MQTRQVGKSFIKHILMETQIILNAYLWFLKSNFEHIMVGVSKVSRDSLSDGFRKLFEIIFVGFWYNQMCYLHPFGCHYFFSYSANWQYYQNSTKEFKIVGDS